MRSHISIDILIELICTSCVFQIIEKSILISHTFELITGTLNINENVYNLHPSIFSTVTYFKLKN